MDIPAPPTNRLSLAHLLLWMAVTGVLFGLLAAQMASEEQAIADYRDEWIPEDIESMQSLSTYFNLLHACIVPFEAMAVASVFLWPWRRRQFRGGFPMQPGHWLLLTIGFTLVANDISQRTFWLIFDPLLADDAIYQWLTPEQVIAIIRALQIVQPGVAALLLASSLRCGLESRTWIAAVGTLTGALVLLCIGEVIGVAAGYQLLSVLWAFIRTGQAVFVVGFVLALVAVGRDVRLHVPRDFFHYVGIVVLAAVVFERLGIWIINRLTYPVP